MTGSVGLILAVLAAVIYLLPTAIFLLRSDQLVGVYKWLYGLIVVPVFVVLMVLNLWTADHLFPGALDWLVPWLHERHSGRGMRYLQAVVLLLITCILPAVVCFAWYVLFVRLSRGHRK